MKKLNIGLGGHKHHGDDYEHLQNGLIEAFKSLVDGFKTGQGAAPTTPHAIHGIKLTLDSGTSYTWTDGWAFVNGELFFVEAEAVAVDVSVFDFFIDETYTVGNPVSYKDGSLVNVHQLRVLKSKSTIVEGGAGVVGVLNLASDSSPRMIDLIATNLSTNTSLKAELTEGGWTSSDFTFQNGWSDVFLPPLQYRILGNKIEWRGSIKHSTPTADPIILLLGSSIDPSGTRAIPVAFKTQAGAAVGSLVFDSIVKIEGNPTSTSVTISLDGVSYFL